MAWLSRYSRFSLQRGNLEEALAYAKRSYEASSWRPGSIGVYAAMLRQPAAFRKGKSCCANCV